MLRIFFPIDLVFLNIFKLASSPTGLNETVRELS